MGFKMKTLQVSLRDVEERHRSRGCLGNVEPIIVKEEGEGYYVRYAGGNEQINLAIHVSCMEAPVQDNETINLLRGFDIPPVAGLLAADAPEDTTIRFLFAKSLIERSPRDVKYDAFHMELCDPDQADCLLVTFAYPSMRIDPSKTPAFFNSESEMYLKSDASKICNSYVEGFSHYQAYNEHRGRTLYAVIPLGQKLFHVVSGEKVRLQLKQETIRLANDFLKIPNGSYEDETENRGKAEDVAKDKIARPRRNIPNLPKTGREMTFWRHHDILSFEWTWVTDRLGRELQPDESLTQDERSTFEKSTMVAEWVTWTNVPEDALVLTCRKNGVLGQFEFLVEQMPDNVPVVLLEATAEKEKYVQSLYDDRLAYNGEKSPDIGEGWGLWNHKK